MKNKRTKNSGVSVSGTVIFFVLIATIIQIAILVYDFISHKTSNKGLISVLILAVIAFLAIIFTLCDTVRRKIMVDRPVRKILEATQKIARGDFSVCLDIAHEYRKYNEYDLIMENLNVMAAQLQQTEVLKTDFISNVSHEIKTPLAVIQNYATLLQDETLDAESRKKYSKTLLEATRRLSDLITNILKLNKLENQELKPEAVKFNLTEALTETVLNFEDLIESKEIELICDFDDVYICSSPGLLETVWNNLLSNAIKFTDTGGKISISLKTKENAAEIQVSDTGCGISPDIGAKIFEKFYQGDTSHAQEGNGLGLSLVKKVIDILGGEITVHSEPSKGSTFTVILKDLTNEA